MLLQQQQLCVQGPVSLAAGWCKIGNMLLSEIENPLAGVPLAMSSSYDPRTAHLCATWRR